MHRLGAPPDWCKIHLWYILVALLHWLPLKPCQTYIISLTFTHTLTPKEKEIYLFYFIFLLRKQKKKRAYRIQNCSLGNTIFGNNIGYKHLKGKFRHFPRCSLRFLKRFTLYKTYPFVLACFKNHFPESATWIFRRSAIFEQVAVVCLYSPHRPLVTEWNVICWAISDSKRNCVLSWDQLLLQMSPCDHI